MLQKYPLRTYDQSAHTHTVTHIRLLNSSDGLKHIPTTIQVPWHNRLLGDENFEKLLLLNDTLHHAAWESICICFSK